MRTVDRPLEEQFVRHYLRRIVDRGQGTGPEGEWCARTKPQRTYFIGGLAPDKAPDTVIQRKLDERYAPSSCGLEFRIPEQKGHVRFACAFSIYVLCYAPFERLTSAQSGHVQRYYRRYRVSFQSDSVALDTVLADLEGHAKRWTVTLNDSIAVQLGQAVLDPYSVKGGPDDGDSIEEIELPSADVTATKAAYQAFLSGLGQGKPYTPAFLAEITLEARMDSTGRRIRLFLQNRTPDPGTERPDQDGGFYGTDLSCRCEGFTPLPITLHRSARTDYRYQFTSHGRGINCSLTEETLPGGLLLKADFAPSFEQKRYLPEEKAYKLFFEDLSTDPVPTLRPIVNDMKEYAVAWEGRIARREDGIKSAADCIQAEGYLAKFRREIARYEAGIAVLQRADALGQQLRTAFALMNQTFEQLDLWRLARKGQRFRGWRMFQLIFIVSNLPELLARAEGHGHDAPAELLFFPTGGGKTEAVMGIVVTALFYDRLRGRKRGVTSWNRFPLRLLTFQQMQRYLDITVAAEVVRARFAPEWPALAEGDRFQIGYYGGGDNSPNDLLRFNADSVWAIKVAQELSRERGHRVEAWELSGFDVLRRYPEAFQRYRMVGDCPYCGREDSVQIIADEDAIALRHQCKACAQVLPLVIVDADIYAEVPAILVGTLDKIANIGFRLGIRTLLGKADGRCRKHGYGTFGRCLKADFDSCKHTDWESFKGTLPVDPAISISFQDELHLLNEELGCFDAHYEAVLDALCEDAGSARPKVLCASATIEGAENQVDHLYRRQLERFPGEGPQLRETFYAKEQDQIQRIFCGLKPTGMQPLDMTMALVTTLALENDLLRTSRADAESNAGYGFLSQLSLEAYDELIDRHTLLVPYVNSKPDGAEIERSIDEQVQDGLERAGAQPLYPSVMLTGETEMPDVKSILRRMETPRYQATKETGLDVAIATSMISHGVDVDRLNQMVFYSFPRTTAEYIQATSRAGRTYPGLVFVVLKASSQRDRSYFRHFAEVHYALDQMVEAVPIDRFAANAADRTVPGVALAWLLGAAADWLRNNGQLSLSDARTLDLAATLRRLVAKEGILSDTLTVPLERIYDVTNPQAALFGKVIRTKLTELENNLAMVGENQRSIPYALNESTTRVMTSLRDVDPGVPIHIENRVKRS